MTDRLTFEVAGNSVEQVAYKLLEKVMLAERLTTDTASLQPEWTTARRAQILNIYAECLQAAKGERALAAAPSPSSAAGMERKR